MRRREIRHSRIGGLKYWMKASWMWRSACGSFCLVCGEKVVVVVVVGKA